MRHKSGRAESSFERIVKNICRGNAQAPFGQSKNRIVLDGLRGETSIAELCRREVIARSMYYRWWKEFLKADKRWLAGGSARRDL